MCSICEYVFDVFLSVYMCTVVPLSSYSTEPSTDISQVGGQHVVSSWSRPHYNNGLARLTDTSMLCDSCVTPDDMLNVQWNLSVMDTSRPRRQC